MIGNTPTRLKKRKIPRNRVRGVAHAQKQPPNAISITVDNLVAKLSDDRLRCLEVSGSDVTILLGPPANIRYGITVLI